MLFSLSFNSFCQFFLIPLFDSLTLKFQAWHIFKRSYFKIALKLGNILKIVVNYPIKSILLKDKKTIKQIQILLDPQLWLWLCNYFYRLEILACLILWQTCFLNTTVLFRNYANICIRYIPLEENNLNLNLQ